MLCMILDDIVVSETREKHAKVATVSLTAAKNALQTTTLTLALPNGSGLCRMHDCRATLL